MVVITPPNDFSMENGQWEVFTDRSNIRALLLSDDGKTLWVGSLGGLEQRDAQTGEIRQVFLNMDGLPDNSVNALLSDSQGGLWVGTDEGLAHYTASGQWQVFNTDNSGLPANEVSALLSDSQGGLWMGTIWDGLAHYTASGQWEVFKTDNSGLPGNYVRALLSDSQGGLWVGTHGGLAHYTASGQWQVFNTDNSGLPDNWINALTSDNQGGLWVGISRGLAHLTFSRQTELCTQFQIDTTTCQILIVDNKMPATMMLTARQTVMLQAKATVTQGIVKRVWAVIRPPAFAQILDTSGTPILAFLRLNLGTSPETPDIWQAIWNEAVYSGNYRITFYAEDNEKNIASSELDTVLTVTGGIDPPSTAQVQIHLEKDRYQRGEAFKATLMEDLGWGYDLYAEVLFPDGKNFMTLKNTNDLRPLNEAKPWYTPRQPHQAVTLFDLTLPTGQYCLFGILSPEQNDVLETLGKGLWVMEKKCFEIF